MLKQPRQRAADTVARPEKASARVVAVDFLQAVLHAGRRLDHLNDNRSFLALQPRDRRLAFELVHGVLRHKLRLDFYITSLAERPIERLDSVVATILRVALYQLEYLRIAERAAVHEAVDLCGPFAKKSASGFVNAVLRSFLRQKPELPAGGGAGALAVRHSHPQWLVERYVARYGEQATESLLERNNASPPPVVRVNTFKNDLGQFLGRLQADSIEHRVLDELPDSVLVLAPTFSQHPIYGEGLCYFMDAASQEIAGLGDVQGANLIGDFCAAPGGKTFILASRAPSAARVLCCDVNLRRLREMRDRASLYAVPRLHFVHADATQPLPFSSGFDFILADVPCTGLGTLRSNPDVKWKISEDQLERYQAREIAILTQSFAALRSGGRLVYSTCSTEPEENEQVVEAFLQSEPNACLLGPFFRSYPMDHLGECFFAARIGHI